MKKISLKSLAVVGVALATLSSCNSMKGLDKDFYTVNPNPLEVHGGKVSVDISAKYPAKMFKKSVAMELTPELRYEGGNSEFKMTEFQGEEFAGNATVIPYEKGKSISYTDTLEYKPEMEHSKVFIKILGKKGDKTKEFEPIEVAEGVITTSLLVEGDYKSSNVPPNYKQTTNHDVDAMINFNLGSSAVKSSELRQDDYKAVKTLVSTAGKNDKLTITGISLVGFASPEGEAEDNTKLSDDRATKVQSKVEASVKKAKIEYQDGFFAKDAKGADWDGVYAAIKESSIKDKDMILRSLDEQPLLDSKEKTLNSLSNTYDVLKDSILPQLRRTQIVVKYDLVGKTDEEIKALSAKSVEELKVELVKADGSKAYQIDAEELLYAAKLSSTKEERLAIMKKGTELYPADYRFATNAGHCSLVLGNTEDAISYFEKAYGIEENDVTINNLAVAKGLSGDEQTADELFLKSTTAEAAYNRGVKAIKEGKYDKAISAMQGKNTFNLALAKVLNGDYDGGIKTLEAGEIETAKGDYLKAIASQRLGKTDDAKKYIASATEKDPKLGEKAKTDLEFREIYNATEEESK